MPSEKNMWIQYSRENLIKRGRGSFPFVPGFFFIVLGLLVVFAPRLVIAVIATVLLFVGGLMCLLAWKFMQLKRRITSLSQEMDGKVNVHTFQVRTGRGDFEAVDSKKIVYH